MIAFTILSLLLPALVSAHGYVTQVTIDGKVYPGNDVGTTPTVQSVIRQVNTNSPVKGASNPDLNCGPSAQLASQSANANPGSTVLVQWGGGTTPGTNWPHTTGPIMHYMAKCDGSCTSYDSSGAEWFKISEQGLKPGNTSWYQADLQSGSPATVTIPSSLASGNYLLRSEIIGLQLAMSQGGAEFYTSCIQMTIGGSQTGQPSPSEEVTFPGGYTDTEAGILTPNIYNPPIMYTFPGPPVASFIAGGSNSTGLSGSGSSSLPPVSSPSPMPSPLSPGSGYSSLPPVSSPSPMPSPSSPVNAGGNPASAVSPSPSPTTGPGSTCMQKRSTIAHIVGQGRRMHRRRRASN